MSAALLQVDRLSVAFGRGKDRVLAVDDVSFSVARGDIVGLVGESGSGKSTVARAILGLEPAQSGAVLVDGRPVAAWLAGDPVAFRRRVQLVFQDPVGSLNPRLSVGGALEEVLQVHGCPAADRAERVGRLLQQVGLDPSYAGRYPHEFSGGQRQRIGIARALAVDPDVLVADEPVSALDVSVQVQILNLLRDLQRARGLTLLVIAHDLAAVRYLCDRVLVMYRGRLFEAGPAAEVYAAPAHPYTRLLLDAVPDVERGLAQRGGAAGGRQTRRPLPGAVGAGGCVFQERCPRADEACVARVPDLRAAGPNHQSACLFPEDVRHGGRTA